MRRFWICAFASCIALGAALAACSRNTSTAPRAPGMQLGFDVRPIDAETLATNIQERHRALMMPVGEMAARLGSFRYDAEDTIRIEDSNGQLLSDKTRSFVLWDQNGSVHMQTANPTRSLELMAIGEKAYVRLDRGHLRYKSRRDVDVHEMVNAAAAGLSGLLSAYGGATLSKPESGVLGEVSVWTYNVAAKEREVGEAPQAHAPLSPGALPQPLPATWSEGASHKEITGKLAVDAATGTILRASVEGRMQINVGQTRPLTLTLMHRHVVRNVGNVSVIEAPSGTLSEYRRPLRPREPLAFFKQHLAVGDDGLLTDRPAEGEAPAPEAKPAAAPSKGRKAPPARR